MSSYRRCGPLQSAAVVVRPHRGEGARHSPRSARISFPRSAADVGRGRSAGIEISTHLPPPVMMESTAALALVTHILCWSWAMCFSAAASSENDQGSMNLASNTAPVPSTMPSRVAAIHLFTGCRTRRWMSLTAWPVLRSYQSPIERLGHDPSWTIRFADRSSGSTSPRFSRQRRIHRRKRWRPGGPSPQGPAEKALKLLGGDTQPSGHLEKFRFAIPLRMWQNKTRT